MPLPRITVVTPSFNQGAFLETTIRSVLDQGYPNLEYIVCDGGSTDQSVEIIRRYESRLAWWVSEKDRGQSDAINKGFARATGELYCYINSDDTLAPGSLAAAADAFGRGHEWITGWVMFLEPNGAEWPQLPQAMQTNIDWMLSNPICQQATYWSARLARELGPFRTDMHYAFDYDFWVRIWYIARVKPLMLRRCMGGYRLHENSKTVSQWDAFEPDFQKVRDEYRKYLSPAEQRDMDQIYHTRELRETRHQAWAALMKRDADTARKHAKKVLSLARFSPQSWKLWLCAMRGY